MDAPYIFSGKVKNLVIDVHTGIIEIKLIQL